LDHEHAKRLDHEHAKGLDHEHAKGTKGTKHEEHEEVRCRVHFLHELRASRSSCFAFFAGLRVFVIQTRHPLLVRAIQRRLIGGVHPTFFAQRNLTEVGQQAKPEITIVQVK
jgi:hypothetical protein